MFIISVVFYIFIEFVKYSVNSGISCGTCKLVQTTGLKKKYLKYQILATTRN
jgi:hypothetical protein